MPTTGNGNSDSVTAILWGVTAPEILCANLSCVFCQVLCWEIVWRNIKDEVIFGSVILCQEHLN